MQTQDFQIPTLFELSPKGKADYRQVAVATSMAAFFVNKEDPTKSNRDDMTDIYNNACDELVMQTQTPTNAKDAMAGAPGWEQLKCVQETETTTIGDSMAQFTAITSDNNAPRLACIMFIQGTNAVCVSGSDMNGFIVLDPSKNRINYTKRPEYGVADLSTETTCQTFFLTLSPQVNGKGKEEEDEDDIEPMDIEEEEEEEKPTMVIEKIEKAKPKPKTKTKPKAKTTRKKRTTTATTAATKKKRTKEAKKE
jgi:hypothetical protein